MERYVKEMRALLKAVCYFKINEVYPKRFLGSEFEKKVRMKVFYKIDGL